jgi:23S rRNA pseudouridine1911/1915/1917 synthase
MTAANIPILFEDADLLVVSKPPGLVVNLSQTVSEPTLEDWLGERLAGESQVAKAVDKEVDKEEWQTQVPADFPHEYGSPEEIFVQRGGIVHRLDKETSGVIVMAKHPGSLANLLRQFRLRETEKMYTCLVHGKFEFPADTLNLPLGRSLFNRTKFAVAAEGRQAETRYEVVSAYEQLNPELVATLTTPQERNLKKRFQKGYQGFSLVHCWPKTGRTHQIRVHMSHIKHPIVSDVTYLGKKRLALDLLWCPRLFLHASQLTFTHPRTGKRLTFEAPLWADLQRAQEFFAL